MNISILILKITEMIRIKVQLINHNSINKINKLKISIKSKKH